MTNSASKTLYVFSTFRSRNLFYSQLIGESKGAVLPDTISMGEFFESFIVVKNKKKVPSHIAKIILLHIIKSQKKEFLKSKYDERLFEINFLSYLETRDFIFNFYNELYAHKIDSHNAICSDIYGDYSDRFEMLDSIYKSYLSALESMNMYDKPHTYEVIDNLLVNYDCIELFLYGSLTKREEEILNHIAKKIKVILHLSVDDFNRNLLGFLDTNLLNKIQSDTHNTIDFTNNQILKSSTFKDKIQKVEIYKFSYRLNQVSAIFKTIDKWQKEGIDSNDIVVVVPDSSFAKYLALYDVNKILNYSMGYGAQGLLSYLVNYSDNTKDLFQCINNLLNKLDFDGLALDKHIAKEVDLIEQDILNILTEWSFIKDYIDNFEFLDMLQIFIQEIESISISDVQGGAIRVSGTLETRGMDIDNVIIVDFNDKVIPNIGDNDMFLNSKIRQMLQMPTLRDKENLQNHYYYALIKNAKNVVISMVENDLSRPASLFLHLYNDPSSNVTIHEKDCLSLYEYKKLAPYIYEEKSFYVRKEMSKTSLKTLLSCKRQYYYKYDLRLKTQQNDNAIAGNITHKILEDSFNIYKNNEKIDWQVVQNEANKIIKEKYQKATDGQEKLQLKRIELNLKDYFQLVKNHNRYHLGCEVEFKNIDIEGFKFNGKIDRIEFDDECIYIIDYKTSKKESILKETKIIKNDSQDIFEMKQTRDFSMAIYKIAIENMEIFKNHRNKRIKANFVGLTDVEIIPEELEDKEALLRDKLETLRSYISEQKLDATQNLKMCEYCDFKDLCDQHDL